MAINEFKNCYNNSTIFQFLSPNQNEILSSLSGNDLQDLMILIDETYLQLRPILGFKQTITFGLEIEAEYTDKVEVREQIHAMPNFEKWFVKGDDTLYCGAEVASPILKDTKATWQNLQQVCSIVTKLAVIGKKSGGHIHVGSQILDNNKDSFLNFIKIWSVYEDIIFRFAYGEFRTARPEIAIYAAPVSELFWNINRFGLIKGSAPLEEIITEIQHSRNQAVNFCNVKIHDNSADKNTIEFRCPNGTLNPVIWQNNVNLFVKLLLYAQSSSFNNDLVEERHQINGIIPFECYDAIYLEQALELCDMIFDNNLDKVYFLKQYLKSLDTFTAHKKHQKIIKLTK